MKHIDRDLAAYTEGLLPDSVAMRVRGHLAVCRECREKLSQHEEMVWDLKIALTYAVPRERQVSDWWQNIVTAPHKVPVRSRTYLTMLPAVLTVLFVILPFSLAIAGHARTNTAPVSATMSSPAANTTITAPESDKVALLRDSETTSQPQNGLISATPISVNGTPVPIIPAPLAP
jgi:anti-sigma factor RsiW